MAQERVRSAAEIGYLLEQRNELYALLDLDFFGWVGNHNTGRATMLRNLAAVLPNYRDLGVTTYVLAYFVPDSETLDGIRQALGMPLADCSPVRAPRGDRTPAGGRT